MANSIASLVPILVDTESVPYLRHRGGLVQNVYSVRAFTDKSKGGDTVTITLPSTYTQPGTYSFTTANATQDIVLPSVTLTVNKPIYRLISLNDLEDRITQGNGMRILKETMDEITDSLLFEVEKDIAAYWPYFPVVGSNSARLTDATMRQAMVTLMGNRVDPKQQKVVFRGTSAQYGRDLLSIDRYVLAINQGEGIQAGTNSVVATGQLPSLYNIGADWSAAMPSQSLSGAGTEVGMMFEKYAIGIAFLEFRSAAERSAGSAAINETYTRDPESGIRIRWRTYMTPNPSDVFLEAMVMYGTTLIDRTRGVSVWSSTS